MVKSKAKIIYHNGLGLTVRQWADKLSLSLNEMNRRLAKGIDEHTFDVSNTYCDGHCFDCPYPDCINPDRVESEWEEHMNSLILHEEDPDNDKNTGEQY